MCRWIAYRGDTIALEHYVTAPAHSLIAQSIEALETTARTNGDGFGLGWYGDHPEPGLYREVRPAWSDENLRYLCRHIQSHLFFAHVRSATGTPPGWRIRSTRAASCSSVQGAASMSSSKAPIASEHARGVGDGGRLPFTCPSLTSVGVQAARRRSIWGDLR